jgi:6-phosphofructokinase
MADNLKGSAVFAQSGGPTAVVNASMAGAILEAGKVTGIERLLAAHGGILGVLQEEFFDLRKERAEDIENLKRTPAAALGTSRHQVKSGADLERILEVLRAHNVRYFFFAGGNDSMDTADRVAKLAAERDYELRVVGIPKTIDNDLAGTDHSPGYASAVKFSAAQVMEAGRDAEAFGVQGICTIQETMGRNAGWLAAGTGLARRSPEDAPHLIYVPEHPVSLDQLADDVRECLRLHRRCFIAAAEGLKNAKGEYLAETGGAFGQDAFGHRQLGGLGEHLRAFVEKEVGVRCRVNRSGTGQRAAMHFASLTDMNEAAEAGAAAVRKAAMGQSGVMITLVREPGPVYRCTTGTARLSDVANGEKLLPKEYLNAAGNDITEALKQYLRPLLRGEVPINIGPDGLPVFVRLQKRLVPRKLAEWKQPAEER